MTQFSHLRHKEPAPLARPRELAVACPPLRSNVNLARIVRAAGCCGVEQMIVCGPHKIDPQVARDAAEKIQFIKRRTLAPELAQWKQNGYQLVGLEQTTASQNLHDFQFARRTLLIVGHERLGLADDILRLVDVAVEIPVYGLPYSYNVATAAAIAMYEYCRQFPEG